MSVCTGKTLYGQLSRFSKFIIVDPGKQENISRLKGKSLLLTDVVCCNNER
jgi:hypothetical protein